jgi:hypothetical protein
LPTRYRIAVRGGGHLALRPRCAPTPSSGGRRVAWPEQPDSTPSGDTLCRPTRLCLAGRGLAGLERAGPETCRTLCIRRFAGFGRIPRKSVISV